MIGHGRRTGSRRQGGQLRPLSCRVLSSLTWRLAACPLGAQQCTSYAKTGECVQALGPAQWQGASHNNRPMRHTRWAVRPPLPRASHPLPRAVRLPAVADCQPRGLLAGNNCSGTVNWPYTYPMQQIQQAQYNCCLLNEQLQTQGNLRAFQAANGNITAMGQSKFLSGHRGPIRRALGY